MISQQQSLVGLLWFCQLETNPATLSLFNYHHGTGPRSHKPVVFMQAVVKQAFLKVKLWHSSNQGCNFFLRDTL